jgi:hypothetical protein
VIVVRAMAALLAALVCASLLGACSSVSKPVRDLVQPESQDPGEFWVHPHYAAWGPVEVALVQPSGRAPGELLGSLRTALYQGLLDADYSPLSPQYVDASAAELGKVGGPAGFRCHIEAMSWTDDGRARLHAWAALVIQTETGEESLYLARFTQFIATDEPLPDARRTAAEAGRKLGAAFLSKLPPR